MKRALRESDGGRLQSDLLALDRSLRLFIVNCDELLGFLNAVDGTGDPAAVLDLWSLQHRDQFDRFFDEVDRLLHNVVAAASSLREHSYRVRDKWLGPSQRDSLRQQYDERVRH